MTATQDHRVLGLEPRATYEQIREARRALSLVHHPDRGGDPGVMAAINAAADRLLSASSDASVTDKSEIRETATSADGHTDVDRPSFVIDALPVFAHELLFMAASIIGEVVDDDPPYLLEFAVGHGNGERTWCRAELVPDAGSSTVSLLVEGRMNAERVRDHLVREINTLELER